MKRNYIGASHIEPCGSLNRDARTKGAPIDPDNTGTVLGFRLAADTEGQRVFRGGCWNYSAQGARVALRFRYVPTYRSRNLGFRLTRDEEEGT